MDALTHFQSSPACAEFLGNLPGDDDSGVSIVSGSELRHLNLDDASSSSRPAPSRFLTFKYAVDAPTTDIEECRVTLTSYLVRGKVDSMFSMYWDTFDPVFRNFVPHGSEFLRRSNMFSFIYLSVWFLVLAEDHLMEERFGKLDQAQQDSQGRTILCQFFLWPRKNGATPEREEASAADPLARESWSEAIARVMPPATAWEQERWDIRALPPIPEPYLDLEDDEYEEDEQESTT